MTDKHKQHVATEEGAKSEFIIQRIYVKDVSYEAPGVPDIFRSEWKPQVDFNLATDSTKLSDDVYEVVLKVTVNVKVKDKVAFLIELHQAGIFTLKLFPKDQLGHMLGSFCPNVLFPYAREAISDLVNRGTFPPFYLAPINFEALYQQYLEREKEKEQEQEKESKEGSDK